ncbi:MULTISPECIES: large conductance mechanosensitive channel protein MscL [Enterococcaceae]|uniref:large conductance mechanosensitive channel protein MscL n=1 Tax=Enterococcaceae TaxID=81852 RepID=UPI000E4CABC1|nr:MULTISPECIES: large conductance mechanosensitive channel protein MscL [Enterococcaceae]RGI32074.1 large conductance mechanosensitive channel protein MscL [Melissococcus sp. OM08-11BH]UNM89778.1 large conductance mechanosensitive channel protein MscL [Vagococcus sp. CY52-2]
MVKEFKEFIARGSVIDMAVGIIIGGAFTSVVNALVDGMITPIIGLIISFLFPGAETVEDATKGLTFIVNGVTFDYGKLISAIITFLITAFVLFIIVKSVNKAETLMSKPEEEEEQKEEEQAETTEDVLKDIRQLLASQVATDTKDEKTEGKK